LWPGLCLAVLTWALGSPVHAQSPYGLAARQTIPFVIDEGDIAGPVRSTEINVHNPSSQPITVMPTYLGAVGTATPGRITCNLQTVTVPARGTAEFSLSAVCPLSPGLNFGRLELTTLASGGTADPAGLVFLANARITVPGRYFPVEGFPEGNLSGNKVAAVTGLKSGFVDGSQWQTRCYAAALNDPTAAIVRLVDGSGNAIGSPAGVPLDPTSAIEMQLLADVFAAVSAPPGNYGNVTALFSSFLAGPGVLGFCRIVNLTTGQDAFEIAKYLDNNDEGRQYHTAVTGTRLGPGLGVIAEVDPDDKIGHSNLHVAYFQHPDQVRCSLREIFSNISTFDTLQFRLIDPEDQVVATSASPPEDIVVDLPEKPQQNQGRNGRWIIEVGPRRTDIVGCGKGLSLCNGGVEATTYALTCSSGNGHNQLDVIGHCDMDCTKDPQQKHQALCAFDSQFNTNFRCSY
jgi:hypothetical protein